MTTRPPMGGHLARTSGVTHPVRRIFKGCLTVLAVFLLLIISCAVYLRHPRFKSPSPLQIHVEVWPTGGSTNEYRMTITNSVVCRTVVETFKKGTWTIPHMCKHRVTFTIRYDDGTTDVVGYMPGHSGPESCEIEVGSYYRLARTNLYQVMRDAGVDISKIPED